MIERIWLILIVLLHALAAPVAGGVSFGSDAERAPTPCQCCCGADVCPCAGGSDESRPSPEAPAPTERLPRLVAVSVERVAEAWSAVVDDGRMTAVVRAGETVPGSVSGPARQAMLCIWRT